MRKKGLGSHIYEKCRAQGRRFLEFDNERQGFVEAAKDRVVNKIVHELRTIGKKEDKKQSKQPSPSTSHSEVQTKSAKNSPGAIYTTSPPLVSTPPRRMIAPRRVTLPIKLSPASTPQTQTIIVTPPATSPRYCAVPAPPLHPELDLIQQLEAVRQVRKYEESVLLAKLQQRMPQPSVVIDPQTLLNAQQVQVLSRDHMLRQRQRMMMHRSHVRMQAAALPAKEEAAAAGLLALLSS